MTLSRATFAVLVGQLGNTLLRAILSVLTARLLGPAARGEYAVFYSEVALVSSLSGLGFAQATVYFVSRAQDVEEVAGTNAFLLVVVGALLAPILLLYQRVGLSTNDAAAQTHLFLTTIAVTITLSDSLLSSFLLGKKEYGRYRRNMIMQASAGVMAALALTVVPPTAETAIKYRIVAEAFVVLYLAMTVIRATQIQRLKLSVTSFLRHAHFGIKSYVPNLLNVAHSRVHLLLLASLAGQRAAGIFSVSMLFMEPITLVPNALGTAMLPAMSAMSNRFEAATITATAVRRMLLLSLVALGIWWLPISWLISAVFGAEYNGAITAARLVMTAAVVAVPVQVLTRFFTSGAQQQFYTLSMAAAVLVAAGSSYWLIPRWGIIGAACSLLLSSATGTTSMLMAFRTVGRVSIGSCVIARRTDVARIAEIVTERFRKSP